MNNEKITEFKKTTNQVDKSIIHNMNVIARRMRDIAEEMQKDAQEIQSAKLKNHENK
jgi:hypothetical protein